LVSLLKNKILIFAPSCNILCVCNLEFPALACAQHCCTCQPNEFNIVGFAVSFISRYCHFDVDCNVSTAPCWSLSGNGVDWACVIRSRHHHLTKTSSERSKRHDPHQSDNIVRQMIKQTYHYKPWWTTPSFITLNSTLFFTLENKRNVEWCRIKW